MTQALSLKAVFPVKPRRIYEAWLSSKEHSRFTGSPASIEPRVGSEFTAWDGYIRGRILELEPPHRILQAWRTEDFPPESPDSLVEVLFTEVTDGTLMILKHTLIPEGQAVEYEQGWIDYYIKPMQEYFAENEETS